MTKYVAIGKTSSGKTVWGRPSKKSTYRYSPGKKSPKRSEFKSHAEYSKASYAYSKSKRASIISRAKSGAALSKSELRGAGITGTAKEGYKYYDSATKKYITTTVPKPSEVKTKPKAEVKAEKKWYYDPTTRVSTTRVIKGQEAMTKQEVFNVMRNMPRQEKVSYGVAYKKYETSMRDYNAWLAEQQPKKQSPPLDVASFLAYKKSLGWESTKPTTKLKPTTLKEVKRIIEVPSRYDLDISEKKPVTKKDVISPPISTKKYVDYVKSLDKKEAKYVIDITPDVSKVEPYINTKVDWNNYWQIEKSARESGLLLQHLRTQDQTIPKKQQKEFQKYMDVQQNIQKHYDREWAKIVGTFAATAVGMGYAAKIIPGLAATKVPVISQLTKFIGTPKVSAVLKYGWGASLGYRGYKQIEHFKAGEWERGVFGLGRLGAEYAGVKVGTSGRLKLPELKKIKLASYKGLGYEYGSYGKPLVGKADGKVVWGTKPIELTQTKPFTVSGAGEREILFKSLKGITRDYNIKGITKITGFEIKPGELTGVSGTMKFKTPDLKGVFPKQRISSTELEKLRLLFKYTKPYETTSSKYVVDKFLKESRTFTPKEMDVILKSAVKQGADVTTIFGSGAAYQQTLPSIRRVPGDMDMFVKMQKADAIKFANKLSEDLAKLGGRYQVQKGRMLVEKWIPGKVGEPGKWVHAVDIHTKEIESMITSGVGSKPPVAEKAYGLSMDQKTLGIKTDFGKVQTQPLSEQFVRKLSSIGTVRPGKVWKIEPEAHRMKDIADWFRYYKTFTGDEALAIKKLYDPAVFKEFKVPQMHEILLYSPSKITTIIYPLGISQMISGEKITYPTTTKTKDIISSMAGYKGYPTETTKDYYNIFSIPKTKYPTYPKPSKVYPSYPSKAGGYPPSYPKPSKVYPSYPSKAGGYPPSYPPSKPPSYPPSKPPYKIPPYKPPYRYPPSRPPSYPPSRPPKPPYKPPKTPPPFYLPKFKFKETTGKKKKLKRKIHKFGYSPSLVAGMERITSYKMPTRITGLGIRPVVRKRKKK